MNNVGNIYPKITNKFVYRGVSRESSSMILTRKDPSSQEKEKDRGSQLGAMRHTLRMAISTSRYTKDEAKWAGDIHEGGSTAISRMKNISTIQEADRITDELNNIIGREYGSQNKNASYKNIAEGILNKFYNEGLYTIDGNETDGFNIIKTKISKEQYDQMIKRYESLGEQGDDLPGKPTKSQQKAIDKFIKSGTP